MKNIKNNLDQIGFAFSPKDEIQRKNVVYRKINDLKATQKKIETYVKLFNPSNVDELREEYRKITKEIRSLQ